MLSVRNRTGHGYRGAAYTAAAVIGVATSATVWWLIKPSSAGQHELAAVIRQRGVFNDAQPGQQDLILAKVLSTDSLHYALRDSHFAPDDNPSADEPETLESVRTRLRIDIGQTDEAGMQTVTVRWTGAKSPSAARLINVLARRLLEGGSHAHRHTEGDLRQMELEYAAARQTATDAERRLSEARQQFEAALAVAHETDQTPVVAASPPEETLAGEPTLAPPLDAAKNSWFLFRQQLADLESRRQELAERLMPEHPEMKAIDEKIVTLRARLAQQPPTPAVHAITRPAPVRSVLPLPGEDATKTAARLATRGEALVAAEAEYASAIGRERVAWQSFCAARNRSLAEIQPARFATAPAERTWTRGCIATLCGTLCGALVALIWPARRLTFSTVEEVRAVTRLPVIALSRHTLN